MSRKSNTLRNFVVSYRLAPAIASSKMKEQTVALHSTFRAHFYTPEQFHSWIAPFLSHYPNQDLNDVIPLFCTPRPIQTKLCTIAMGKKNIDHANLMFPQGGSSLFPLENDLVVFHQPICIMDVESYSANEKKKQAVLEAYKTHIEQLFPDIHALSPTANEKLSMLIPSALNRIPETEFYGHVKSAIEQVVVQHSLVPQTATTHAKAPRV